MPAASSAHFDSAFPGSACLRAASRRACRERRHHPDIRSGWGHATVSLSTKKIKGLHEDDFIMASKIDRMIDRPVQNSNRNSAVTLRDADGFVATGVSTFPSFSRWLAHRHRRGRAGLQRHHGLVADPLRTAREPPAPVGSIVVVHADCRDPRCICPRQRHAVRAATDWEKIEWPAFTPSWPLCARSASSAA